MSSISRTRPDDDNFDNRSRCFLARKHDPRIEEFRAGDVDNFDVVLKANVCGALELGWAWMEEKELKDVSFMDMRS